MRIFHSLFVVMLLFLFPFLSNSQNNIIGYVLGRDKDVVIIDLGIKNTKVGDFFKIIKTGKFFIHPKTGDTIRLKDELVANLKIQATFDNYSEAQCIPSHAIDKVEKGMTVLPVTENDLNKNGSRKSVAVININLMGAFSPFVGLYLADILVTALHGKGDLKIIDRSTFTNQEFEKNLNTNSKINDNEMISSGRSAGVDYFIVGNIECDVNEKQTNVPIKGIMQAAEGISGVNMGAKYMSDVKVKKLIAIASISLKVVDVNTGEILFICNEMTRKDGESNVQLEQGALGGLQLNGGATTFMQTVSGQAAKQGLNSSAQYIVDFFNGKIKQKSYTGNVITKDKKNLSGSSNNFNIGDTIYYTLSQANPALIRCKIIANYPNSNEAQILLFDSAYDKKIIKVGYNRLLDLERSSTHCFLDAVSSLHIGQQVVIYNGNEFSEGIVVSKTEDEYVEISFERKTNKGKTDVHQNGFNKQQILINFDDMKKGSNCCYCSIGKAFNKFSFSSGVDSTIKEMPAKDTNEIIIRSVLSKREISESLIQENEVKIKIYLKMQNNGIFYYNLLEISNIDNAYRGTIKASGNYILMQGNIDNEPEIHFIGRSDDGKVFDLWGSVKKRGTDQYHFKPINTTYIQNTNYLSTNNYRLPDAIIPK